MDPAAPAEEPRPAPETAPLRLLALALAALGLLQLATVLRLAPPAARPASAPASEFSAERALERLARVLGDQRPHPVGTPANEAVRERLVAELRALGLAPEVRDAWAWSRAHRAARTRNVLARIPGTSDGAAVLLLCHHDSVPAGPGAADDGVGVAALLETARALLAGPPLPRPVVLLFTDAEEVGLLGARAFVRDDPVAREVGAVVNVEARGTGGPSVMFETSRGNAWLVRALAGALPRPLCTSLFPTIYERLPNDTDVTAFLEGPVTFPAVNFGHVVDVDHYHTPLDDLAHLSRDTLQHHGENVLATTRALAGLPLESLRGSTDRLVYFDVLGLFVVRWPEPWTLPLALLAAALVAGAIAVEVRRGALRPAAVAWGLLAPALALGAALAAAAALSFALTSLAGTPSPWAASLTAAHGGAWALGLAAVGASAACCAGRAGAAGAWAGVWALGSLAGVLLAATLPGASFLLVVPALAAGATGLAAGLRPRAAGLRGLALLAPFVVAALLWLPVVRGLDWALGLTQKAPVVVAVVVLASALLPLAPADGRARLALAVAPSTLGLAALGVVLAGPAHDAERPMRMSLVFEEDADAGSARWSVDARFGAPPAALIQAGGLAPAPGSPGPWGPGARWEGPTAALGLAPAELTPLEDVAGTDGARRVRVRLRSPRGAWAISVQSSHTVRAVTVGGVRHAPEGGLATFDLLGLPADGAEVELGNRVVGPRLQRERQLAVGGGVVLLVHVERGHEQVRPAEDLLAREVDGAAAQARGVAEPGVAQRRLQLQHGQPPVARAVAHERAQDVQRQALRRVVERGRVERLRLEERQAVLAERREADREGHADRARRRRGQRAHVVGDPRPVGRAVRPRRPP